jgi:hypothetical protein
VARPDKQKQTVAQPNHRSIRSTELLTLIKPDLRSTIIVIHDADGSKAEEFGLQVWDAFERNDIAFEWTGRASFLQGSHLAAHMRDAANEAEALERSMRHSKSHRVVIIGAARPERNVPPEVRRAILRQAWGHHKPAITIDLDASPHEIDAVIGFIASVLGLTRVAMP